MCLQLQSARCPASVTRCSAPESASADSWRAGLYCPCCKRPLEAQLVARPLTPMPHPNIAGRFAFVAALWGRSPDFVLGAMVLGRSLRRIGTLHELVLLHTTEIPETAVRLLARSGWDCREVEAIQGVSELYNHGEPRFDGVFTKLRAMGLVEYEKVCLLDIDTLALSNLDHLFDLQAPAAMVRGPKHGYQHGGRIEGRWFFGGHHPSKSWGQSSGINAGVMLFQPSQSELDQMLLEVLDPKHPSHVRGNGPEQDYLSRYWADCWSHIGVEYNFQLHQMYYALSPAFVQSAERSQFLCDPPGSFVRLVHYSGHLKPWARFLDQEFAADVDAAGDARFLEHTLEAFPGYWLWVKKDRETWSKAYSREGFALSEHGKLHEIDWSRYRSWQKTYWNNSWHETEASVELNNDGHSDTQPNISWLKVESCAEGYRKDGTDWLPVGPEVEVPEEAVRASRKLVENSLQRWNEEYRGLAADLDIADLAHAVREACAPPEMDSSLGHEANGAHQVSSGATAANEFAQVDQVEQTKGQDQNAPTTKQALGWHCQGGWWLDRPLGRVSALAGQSPESFVLLSCGGRALLDLRGPAAVGVHAAAVAPDGAVHILSGSTASWAQGLVQGSSVAFAAVGAHPPALAELLDALRDWGAPPSPPAVDCLVAAAVGRKGGGAWEATMCASDIALATMPCNSGESKSA